MKKLMVILMAVAMMSGIASTQSPVSAKGSKPLSEYGKSAISELATCLRTASTLDVFYLIDSSNSLSKTDKNNKRQEIIKQDILRWAQIGSLKPGLEINIAGALFNRSATTLSGWEKLTQNNANSLSLRFTNRINNQNLGNFTNWKAGLQESYNKLNVRSASCKAVIWFTDGGLWSPYDDREDSLRDLADICGPADEGNVPRSDSSEGLMAQIRRADIHVYGILLHDPTQSLNTPKEEAEEAFYRSLMQPLLEESGQVSGTSELPSGGMKCGENLTGEDKTYASGAFLEATSPADVAFKFMKIPATVQDGTEFACPKNGQFYVDPGIAQVEFATDATSWKIKDSTGKQIYKSEGKVNGTTSKITVPSLDEPETWTFTPTGGSGLCALYVYPQIDLELHDKALVGGRSSSVTGQFFASLTSKEKIDFNVYKKADFSAKVDGYSQEASLNKGTGTFELKNYTPAKDATEVVVTTKLLLETQHYVLLPVELKKIKKVYSPAALPNVGTITFGEPLYGSTGKTTATTVITAPQDTNGTSQVCFEKYSVIGDNQDESKGSATDRSKSWAWNVKGVDEQGCLNILVGTNRDQVVTFELSNPKQANSSGEALFEYRILRDGQDALKDTQTSNFETREKRSETLFLLLLLLSLLFGLGIPFGILTILHRLSTHFVIPRDLLRAEFAVNYNPVTQSMSISDSRFETLNEIPKYFKTLWVDPKQTYKAWLDPSGNQIGQDRTVLSAAALNLTSKPNWWPLGRASYTSTPTQGKISVVAQGNEPSAMGVQQIENPNLENLAYFTADLSDVNSTLQNNVLLPGVLVLYTRQPDVYDAGQFRDLVLGALGESTLGTYLAPESKYLVALKSAQGVEMAVPSSSIIEEPKRRGSLDDEEDSYQPPNLSSSQTVAPSNTSTGQACPNCNAALSEAGMFCPNCGNAPKRSLLDD
jgi:hypothetical protein